MRVIPRAAVACLLVGLLAGCAQGTPTPAPAASLPASFDWSRAAIELPPEVVEIAPGSTAGAQCSPCHAIQASLLTSVASTADGLLAVGLQLPPSEAIAYRSADGTAWTPEPGFEPGEDTAALGVAADGDRRLIVGRDGPSAASWLSEAGGPWQAAPASPTLQGTPGERAEMRSVTPWNGGWVAVGSVDGDASHRTAAIWSSADGLAWERVTGNPGFLGYAAYGVATTDDRLVVVGSVAAGDTSNEPGPAVVWVSDDDRSWKIRSSPSFAAGPMRGVTSTPTGFVAVGFGIDDVRAVAWTSPDGVAWDLAPPSPAFEALGKPIRMAAVVSGDDGLVAAGWKSDAGNGSGTVWRSADGVTWERIEDQVSMSGASLAGVALAGDTPIVVGTSGYPDNDQASAWYEGR